MASDASIYGSLGRRIWGPQGQSRLRLLPYHLWLRRVGLRPWKLRLYSTSALAAAVIALSRVSSET